MRSAAAAVLAVLAACSLPAESGAVGQLPDSKSYAAGGVSRFMEQRCAGLDCHGHLARPLRLYSEWGLRLEAAKDGSRDRRPTTPAEQLENYRAVIGLEPEALSLCFETKGRQCDTVQLLEKPLDVAGGGIRHKGGPVLRPIPSDPGWECLFGWSTGSLDPATCAKAARVE